MELLLQLSTIKSVSKQKMSILDFIIHSIRRNDPSILNFTNDLVTCEFASKIELSFLQTKVKEFETGVEKIKKELTKTEESINLLREELKSQLSLGEKEEES